MQAIQVTCPQCGAALRVAADKDDVTCEYCGALATVQRRSRVLQRVLPPPSVYAPRPTAVERRSGLGILITTLIVMLALGGVSLGIFVSVRAQQQREEAAASTPDAPHLEWQGNGGAIVVGDRVIGRRRQLSPDDIEIVALDAADGHVVWHSPSLGNYDDTYQGILARLGDTLVFASERGKVSALDLATGALRWVAALPERPKRVCASGDQTIIVETRDDVQRPLRTSDGQPPIAPVEAPEPVAAPATSPHATPRAKQPPRPPPPSCQPIQTDLENGDPASQAIDTPRELEDAAGAWASKLLVAPDGTRVLTGRREKGTTLPVLAGFHGDQLVWRVDVPADPLSAQEGGNNVAAIGPGLACASYDLSGKGEVHRLACFGLADGKRAWDVGLTAEMPLSGLVVSDRFVLVSMWGTLEARDRANGALLWKMGPNF